MTVDVAPNEAIPLTVADGVDAGVASFPPKRSLDRGLFLYLPFAFTAALTFAMQTDDPFITLRYAWNLVHGHGPVFNMGERVQGYTSVLHLVVASVAVLVPGNHALLVLKLTSLVFGVLAVREGAILADGLLSERWLRRTAYVVIATSWIIGIASSNALETTMEMWFLTALARRLILDGPTRRPVVLGGLAFLAVMTRLDALAPLVAMAFAGLLLDSRTGWRRRITWFSGAIAAAGLTTVSALWYYGNPLPNTLEAKSVPFVPAVNIANGYLLQPFSPLWLAEIIVVMGLGFAVLGVFTIGKRLPRAAYLLAAIAGQVLVIVKSGGDWMPGDRFLAPVIIPILVVEVLGLGQLVGSVSARMGHHAGLNTAQIAAPLLVVLSLLPLVSVSAPVWRVSGLDNRSLLASSPFEFAPVWVGIPSTLTCVPRGAVVATSEIGYLGFSRPDLRILDL